MSKIIGVPVGTPTPRSDWNQTNPNRADFIKNKPTFAANSNGELETITAGGETYDGFVDYTARKDIEDLKNNGTGGGAGVLMVTINEHDEVSHTNAQIYEHYRNGGMVVADYDSNVFTLISAGENYAYFSRATDDPAIYVLCLEDGGVGYYDEYYLNTAGRIIVGMSDDGIANYNAGEIYEQFTNGNSVVFETSSGEFYALTLCEPQHAVFSSFNHDPHADVIHVWSSGRVEVGEHYFNEGGGSNLLVVTLDNVASHTPKQILEHTKNGGIVLLNECREDDPSFFQLVSCYEDGAIFTQTFDDGCVYYYSINEDGSFTNGEFSPVGVTQFDSTIGNIDAALDAILAIQKELIGVTLITFTIDGEEYQAEDGMTWGEWVGSQYDTKPHTIQYEQIRGDNGMTVYLNDYSSPVYQNETITDGYAYIYD